MEGNTSAAATGYDTWEEAESDSDSEAEPAEPNSTNDGNTEGSSSETESGEAHDYRVIINKTMEMESGLPTCPPSKNIVQCPFKIMGIQSRCISLRFGNPLCVKFKWINKYFIVF